MRSWLLAALMKLAKDPQFVFLTGDLGFNFLEPLQAELKDRFINAGIAEQNMVTVAAGLARAGMRPFCYSISPFLYARAFEQIRVDLCMNQLPVQMIGSGVGFDYGSMGPEHHALEDYGVLLTLQKLTVYTPWCEQAMESAVDRMAKSTQPSYLRLDRRAMDFRASAVLDWHQLLPATSPTEDAVVLCVGSAVIPYYEHFKHLKTARPELWALAKLPLGEMPKEFIQAVQGKRLFVVEEHVPTGSIGEKLTSIFYNQALKPRQIQLCNVQEVFSGKFGQRDFHWKENALLPEQVSQLWKT